MTNTFNPRNTPWVDYYERIINHFSDRIENVLGRLYIRCFLLSRSFKENYNLDSIVRFVSDDDNMMALGLMWKGNDPSDEKTLIEGTLVNTDAIDDTANLLNEPNFDR